MSINPTTMCEILVGLEDISCLEVVEFKNRIKVTVESKNSVLKCPSCSLVPTLKERRPVSFYDLPSFGRLTTLIWLKRRFTCENDACEISTFTELNSSIASERVSLTTRCAKWTTEQVGRLGRSVKEVADELGCNWHSVNDALLLYGELLINDPDRIKETKAIGLDETLFKREGEFKKQLYSSQITDVQRGQLLDIVPGRKGDEPKKWLNERPNEWLDAIKFATLDLSGPYKAVFDSALPNATQIADPFHVVKLANSKLDEVRRRIQNENLGHRGRKDDPLYRCRKLLTMAQERLNEKSEKKLLELLATGDSKGDVTVAWHAKEAIRELYALADSETAKAWLEEISRNMKAPDNPLEVRSLGRTLEKWKDHILAWHIAHYTNAASEAMNNLIKRVKRTAFGFTNFKSYRIRALLYTGGVNWSLLKSINPY